MTGSELFNELLSKAIKLPGVKVDRNNFLRRTLSKYCSDSTVEKAVRVSPAYADIPIHKINKIADGCINLETTKVTGLSFAAGIPGGLAMLGTVPADLVQYFGSVLTILQKLIYLYGWYDLFDCYGELDDEGKLDITMFMGAMFGVNEAVGVISKLADEAAKNLAAQAAQEASQQAFGQITKHMTLVAAKQAAKNLTQRTLTKGTLAPIVNRVSAAVGVKISQGAASKSVSKVIPLLGGFASGGLTFATYRPMAVRLKRHLAGLKTADPASCR